MGLGVAGARCVAALGPDGRIRRGRDDCQAIIIAPARKDSALAVVFDFDGQKSLKEQRGPALSRPAPSRPPLDARAGRTDPSADDTPLGRLCCLVIGRSSSLMRDHSRSVEVPTTTPALSRPGAHSLSRFATGPLSEASPELQREALLTTKEVADLLQISPLTVSRWRTNGSHPETPV